MIGDDKAVYILGGGLTGLSAACVLARAGRAVRVFEAQPFLGGASRTVRHGEFRFDLGGHRFYTRDEEVIGLVRELIGDDLLTVRRISRIYLNGRFADYPLSFRSALSALRPLTCAHVGASYAWSRVLNAVAWLRGKGVHTFEEWVVSRFGRRLYEIYFKPYSEKVWGVSCRDLCADFAEQRIKGLSMCAAVREMIGRTKGNRVKSLIHAFLYPRRGFGQIPEAMARALPEGAVRLGARVTGCRHDGARITEVRVEADGATESHPCNEVIMTLPVDAFVRGLDPPPPAEVLNAADRLRYRDIIICFLVLDRPQVTPDHWIYFSSPDVFFGRMHEPKNWSAAMAPADRTGVVVEIFCFRDDAVWTEPDEHLLGRVAERLEELGLIAAGEAQGGRVVRLERAYPLYVRGYAEHLGTVLDYLGRFENLQCAGRNGLFRYTSGDRYIEMGVKAAKNLLGERHDVAAVASEREYAES